MERRKPRRPPASSHPSNRKGKATTPQPASSDREDVAASCGDLEDREELMEVDVEEMTAEETRKGAASEKPRPGAPPHRKPLTAEDRRRLARRSVEADEQLRRRLWLSIYSSEYSRVVFPAVMKIIGLSENFKRRLIFLENATALQEMKTTFVQEGESIRRERMQYRHITSHLQLLGELIPRTEERLRVAIAEEWEDGCLDLRSRLSLAELPVAVEAVDDICQALLAEPVTLPPQQQISAAARTNSSRGTPLDAFFRAASRAGFVEPHSNKENEPQLPPPASPYKSSEVAKSITTNFNASRHLSSSAALYHTSPTRIRRTTPRPPSAPKQPRKPLQSSQHDEAPATVDDLMVDESDSGRGASPQPQPQPHVPVAPPPNDGTVGKARPQSARTTTQRRPQLVRPLSARVRKSDLSFATRSREGAYDSNGHALTAFNCTPTRAAPQHAATPTVQEARAVSYMSGARTNNERVLAYHRLLGTMGNTQASSVVGAVLASMRPVEVKEAQLRHRRKARRKKNQTTQGAFGNTSSAPDDIIPSEGATL